MKSDIEKALDANLIIKQARDIMAKQNFVVVDTETTGSGLDAEALQLAILDSSSFALLFTGIRPIGTVQPAATRIHGISQDTAIKFQAFPKLYDSIKHHLSHRTICAYNTDFDLRVLATSANKHGLTFPNYQDTFCIMKAFAVVYGEWTEKGGGCYKWRSLDYALDYFNLPQNLQSHCAYSDAQAALRVLQHIAQLPINESIYNE